MTPRRSAQQPDPGTLSRGPERQWPPTCPVCGWSGIATAEASPYIGCGGDPARHQRSPVSAA